MNTQIEFGTTLFCPAFRGAHIAKESEDLGFDVQLFGENHNSAADVFGELRDAARATTKIRLECGPVNFVTRDPGVVASAVAPLQILSGGRAICGVARGDSAVALAGRAPQTQSELARNIELLRSYLHRETVRLGDRESSFVARGLTPPTLAEARSPSTRHTPAGRVPTLSSLLWIGDHSYTPPPIELVCSGPRAIALAARTADRIGLSVGAHPERVRWALAIIEEELARSGRTRADVRIGLYFPIAITDQRADAPRALKYRAAGWAHMSSFAGNDLAAQPPIMRKVTSRLRTGYDYAYHRAGVPADNPNSAQIDEDFADWFGIGGPPAYVVERLGELSQMGVGYFNCAHEGAERERFAAEVIPAFR